MIPLSRMLKKRKNIMRKKIICWFGRFIYGLYAAQNPFSRLKNYFVMTIGKAPNPPPPEYAHGRFDYLFSVEVQADVRRGLRGHPRQSPRPHRGPVKNLNLE